MCKVVGGKWLDKTDGSDSCFSDRKPHRVQPFYATFVKWCKVAPLQD